MINHNELIIVEKLSNKSNHCFTKDNVINVIMMKYKFEVDKNIIQRLLK